MLVAASTVPLNQFPSAASDMKYTDTGSRQAWIEECAVKRQQELLFVEKQNVVVEAPSHVSPTNRVFRRL